MEDNRNIFQKIFGLNKPEKVSEPKTDKTLARRFNDFTIPRKETNARFFSHGIHSMTYDGEKNVGSMGRPVEYMIDHQALSTRSWSLFLQNDIAQTVLSKYTLWIIGKGLKFQATPIADIIGNDPKVKDQVKKTEILWNLWAGSRSSSHDGQSSLNWLSNEAYKNAKVAGDCLVIMRFKDKKLTIQLVDGTHVCSDGMDCTPKHKGGVVCNGIETNKKGEVIAYWVKNIDGGYQRINAIDPITKMPVAFMVYGNKYRIDDFRGMPAITTVMETLQKIDRYKEATVGSAEERQKIAYFIQHELESTGESPFTKMIQKGSNNQGVDDQAQLTEDSFGNQLGEYVMALTDRTTVNMPQGASLKSLESKSELYFTDFYTTNANLVCAAVGIPPNIAFSMYTNSFSASRAATKDWEHTMNVERANFQFQFLQPIYNYWLHIQSIMNRLDFDGYLDAFFSKDDLRLEAFRSARFLGAKFPHIDPEKEVRAERLKLGTGADHIPLTTIDQATEALNGGDAMVNMERYSKEMEEAERLGIEKPEETQPASEPPQD